jgi:class 3 adenylate cyclase/predicted Ser/Thr protein kinase
MPGGESELDRLLKARGAIDEQLRRHKAPLTILFTDVVGSTSYFERYGDTAGLAMVQRHADLAGGIVRQFGGAVVKTIGDSVMADFPDPALAVNAAVEMQRRLLLLNQTLPERERSQLRVGINSGTGFRRGTDVYGDVVNLAARIVKHCGPAQILVSRVVREALGAVPPVRCADAGKISFHGKTEEVELCEVVWTDTATYADLRREMTVALERGELVSRALAVEDLALAAVAGEDETLDGSLPTPAGAVATTAPAALAARYEVLAELGRGGMGIVYKARDRETGEIVALKVLRPEIAARPEVVERFKSELRLARKITHKNVCRMHELLRFGDTVAISMEYVEGESLRAFLQRYKSASLRTGLEWVGQVCSALGEAHAQGVVHRDLKPENIMIARDRTAKVMDFGIARSLEADTLTTGALIGTPAYMSPEQAQGKKADARSDIYSLGLVMYEMFTGKAALRAETPVALALKQIHETPATPIEVEPHLPAFLDRAIQKCLRKDQKERFQCIDELEAALAEKEAPRAESLPQLPTHLSTPRRSDAMLFILGALGLVVFLACAEQIVPETAIRFQFTRRTIVEKARQELSSREPTLDVTFEEPALDPGGVSYDGVAENNGYAEARERLGRDLAPYYSVRCWAAGGSSGDFSYYVNGRLRYFRLPFLRPPGDGLPRSQALDLARREIQRAWGADVKQMAMRRDDPMFGGRGFLFGFVKNRPGRIGQEYRATIYDRLASLGEYSWYDTWHTYPPPGRLNRALLAAIGVLVLFVFLARRIMVQMAPREALVLGVAGFATGVSGFSRSFQNAFEFAASGVTTALGFIVCSATLTHLAKRSRPQLVAVYSSLVNLRANRATAALGFVRGVASGLTCLGFYAILVRLGVRLLKTGLGQRSLGPWPRLQDYTAEWRSIAPALVLVGEYLFLAAATAFLVGFFFVLARRRTPYTVSAVIACGMGWILTMTDLRFGNLPPDGYLWLLTFATVVSFATILAFFDLFTLLVAIFTFHLWLHGYALTVMFEPIGNWQFWLPYVLWGAILAWALFAAFRPLWFRAGKRLAEAFG